MPEKVDFIQFRRHMMTRVTWWDIALIALCLLLTAALCLPRFFLSDGTHLVVSYAGSDKTEEYSLADNAEIALNHNGYSLTLVICGGKAHVEASECPDHVCEHSGEISENGQMIVCAPAGICITVFDENDREGADAVAG